MTSQTQSLQSLLKSFPLRPFEQEALDTLVDIEIRSFKGQSLPENLKSNWEYALKNEIFTLAATEGASLKSGSAEYYDGLRDRLDLVLTFTEHEACEPSFPFVVLQDLLETQTITSCSHIFSWIEERAARLTKEMVPQKGKALILLRTLNDLLRRLSKMGSTTLFCGRILTFLSGVFPLGERSGVNLRGEYGPIWERVKDVEKKDEDINMDSANEPESNGDKMDVDEVKSKVDPSKLTTSTSSKTDGFYTIFWSLQLPFSRPPLFATPGTFNEFKDAVDKVLPVIKEASSKERLMMGNRSAGSGTTGSLKRKRESEASEETNSSDYFFAKFLTSPELLDLEIADTHFRRQILFQLLILLNHLLSFTKVAKAVWSTPRNRSLQMDFTLEPADAQWVQEVITKVSAELRSSAPHGPTFSDTVNIILDREKNWVKWKNDMCAPFDRGPWLKEIDGKKVGLEEATKAARAKRREEPADWQWNLGSQPLTEIWDMGYRDLTDLQNPFQPGDVKDFAKKVKQEDARIDMRRKALARNAERIAQARAKAAPPKEMAPLPAIPPEIPAASSDELKVEQPVVAPRPIATTSPLHPSLPAKPGSSPSKPIPEAGAASPIRAVVPISVPPSVPAPSALSAPVPAPSPAPPPSTPTLPTDDQILKFEENKQRWSWLALRTARDQHLQHFGKIGTGDVILLAQEIDAEKEREKERERERLQKPEEMLISMSASTESAVGANEGPGQGSPMVTGIADEGKISDIPRAQTG